MRPQGIGSPPGEQSELDPGIQALRALAVLLVVAAHVSGPLEGRRDAAARVHEALIFVRMPLLAALSGWVYALRPMGELGIAGYLGKRARRLLLPQLSYGLVLLFVGVLPPRLVWPSSLGSALELLAMPRVHFWFLQALFAISVAVVALEAMGWLRSAERWSVVCLMALLVPASLPPAVWDTGQLARALYLFGYFLLGVGVQRFGELLLRSWKVPVSLGLGAGLALGVLAQQLAWSGAVELGASRGSLLSLLVGVPAVLLLLRHRAAFVAFSWLGPFAFAIYFFHRDGMTLAQRGLERLGGPIGPVAAAVATFVAAVLVPIVAQKVLERWWVTRRLFLGAR